MGLYYVKVRVDVAYEVEANSEEEAEQLGWFWEDHLYGSEVYSINVEELEDEDEEDEEEDED